MYDIKADIIKNRLHIILEGIVDDQEVKSAVFKTLFELNKLRPGFDIIKDLSAVTYLSSEARLAFCRAMEIARVYGINRVVNICEGPEKRHILNHPNIKGNSWSLGENALSMHEAECILDRQTR